MLYAQKETGKYQCTPCGSECDKEVYTHPGECRHCHMKLVKSSTVNFKNIEPSDLCSYIKGHPEVVLLDVRTKEEFEGTSHPEHGTIKNAINIPIQQLEQRIDELSKFREKEIIVYCSHSKRSPRASQLLVDRGFRNITNLAGGMSVMEDDDCITGRRN